MVLAQALRPVGFGLALGLPLAFVMAKLARSLLSGAGNLDSVTISAAVAILAAVTIVAAWLPARRAAAVHPMNAMR
jgi:ABC-type antimicrobial peptide transport system permease subunit